MNEISAKIINIESSDSISLIELKSGNQSFKTVVINSNEEKADYQINEDVNILFKETEVILGVGLYDKISMQNRIPCNIKNIDKGKLLSKVYLTSAVGNICSIITSKSVDRLKLEIDMPVTAMIKTNELMISK